MTVAQLIALSAEELLRIGAQWQSRLSPNDRVLIAHRALRHVLGRDPSGLLRKTYALAGTPLEWREGADLFDSIRAEVLRRERGGSRSSVETMALLLAEMTAQLAFNATSPPYPFDDSVILWLPTTIRALVAEGGPAIDATGLATLVESTEP